jgi:hypothetical protein
MIFKKEEKKIFLVYVYSNDTKELIGIFPTLYCSKFFGIGKDTLSKYLNTGTPYKNKLFYRKKQIDLKSYQIFNITSLVV